MSIVAASVGIALLAALASSRLLALAPTPAGWIMYLANVALEALGKRFGRGRRSIEAVAVVAACALIGAGFHSVAAGATALALSLLLVLDTARREGRVMREVHAEQESVGLRRATPSNPGWPSPGLHPRLSINLEGPFVERLPRYRLGVVAPADALPLSLLVGNHSRVPCQTPVRIDVSVPPGWSIDAHSSIEIPPIPSGRVVRVPLPLRPAAGSDRTPILIRVRASRFDGTVRIEHDGARTISAAEIASAVVTRWPGARRAAFSWRGDMDLYDRATFQTIEGLETAFGLGARYAIAQSMYLSTRLSLDRDAAEAWARHHGIDRGASAIPEFIRWMRERVDLRHSAPYPAVSEKPFVVELGNHGHLHYSTDTSGHPGNGWKPGARAGEGRYPWQGDDASSFGDQRDNILEAARWFESTLGFVPRSWAKPGRGNDRFTPAAVEAAGCEVASGSDIRPRDNVLRQPPPHHPAGTRIVELTSRFPPDPEHVQHLAMVEFWLHRSHRLGLPMVFMVHQHLRQWDGAVCALMTERILRRVVDDFHGDFFVDTVYGAGRYWLDALSPTTRAIEVRSTGDGVVALNRGPRTIGAVPIDLALRDGGRRTLLLDLPPGETIVPLNGRPGVE